MNQLFETRQANMLRGVPSNQDPLITFYLSGPAFKRVPGLRIPVFVRPNPAVESQIPKTEDPAPARKQSLVSARGRANRFQDPVAGAESDSGDQF